jgi:hypothetical protein
MSTMKFALRRSLAAALVALALWCAEGAALAQPVSVAPTGPMWSAGDGFALSKQSKKTRQSLSGIACERNAAQARVCLAVFDEGMQARFAEVGDGQVRPLPGGLTYAVPGKELDAEAATTDGRFFYVAGSHGVKRSDCSRNDSSHYVLRFERDAVTGQAAAGAKGSATPAGYQQSRRLRELLANDPQLRASLAPGVCLGHGALDIEAMAIRAGRLFFGLRGPNVDGDAFIVAVDADAFFAGADPRLTVTRVPVGAQRGLRDMAPSSHGLVLLAGPGDHPKYQDLPWSVLLWNDQAPAGTAAPPRTLATLDLRSMDLRACDKEIKPEAITVLQESPQALQLLVLSDGLCDGGAMVFDIPKP